MTTMTDTSIDPAEAWTTYRHDHLDDLSDRQLVAWAGRHVAVPREAPADSFVLHAPLELAARAALLPFVTPAGRDLARVRLLTLAGAFERSGPAYVPPPSGPAFDRPDEAATALVAAMERGELDDVDAAASWIG